MEDLLDQDAQLSATLMPCGTKIFIEEAAVPHFMHTHVAELLDLVEDAELKRAMTTAHKSKMVGIVERKTKKYILSLPKGLKC